MTPRAVILADGDFPARGGLARAALQGARHVVCCDGAVRSFHRAFRRWPEAVVGDLDSFPRSWRPPCEVVRDGDQDTNDLEKAAAYCLRRGWRSPLVVGATGKREDHTLSNLFRALALGLETITDRGRFVPLEGRRSFRVAKGAAISVFAPDPATRMTSQGLVWPLDEVRFRNLYCAALNRTATRRITLSATRRVYVFFADGGSSR